MKESLKKNKKTLSLREQNKKSDMLDLDNAVMRICRNNLDQYFKKYSCKNENELCDLMWYNYGIYCQIVNG